jgi:polysaccharide chain length determinant protein (PEP-CTERM system associated)
MKEKHMDQPVAMTPADLLAIVRRRKKSLILPAVAVIVLAGLVALLLPPIYRSTATILIEEQEIPTDFVMTTVTSFAEQRIQQINQRIMSFTRLLEIIQRFGLYPELVDKKTTEEIVEQMRKDTELKPVSADVMDRRTGRPTAATIAFTLAYQGKDAGKVQQVANVLTSLFLEENLKERTKQAEETTSFLEGEMARVKEELAGIESRLATFKKAHINALPELMQVNIQSLNNYERNLEITNEQIRGLREREGSLQTQLASVKPHVEKDEELASRKRFEELKIQLVALTKRFSDEHPDVKKTRAEMAELEATLDGINASRGKAAGPPDNPAYITLSAQLSATRADLQSAQRQLERLNAEAAEYRRRIAATPGVEEEYNALVSARNSTQAKVSDLMRKLMEAQVAHGLEKEQKGERFNLIEPPRLPEKPYKPNRLAIMLIGVVLGIGAGVGCAALREFSDDAVRGPEKLESETRFPVLAGIPRIMSPADTLRQRRRRSAMAAGAVGAAFAAIALFHFLVMDLDVLWAKIARRMDF